LQTHPPTLLTLTRRTLVDEALLGARGQRDGAEAHVLVAVSGGPDSTALLHVLARLRRTLGFELSAHGVDHGLRSEAERELDQVQALAAQLAVPFKRTVTKVAAGGNLQARARAVRLEALRAAAAKVGATCIATAHHADDRAETVLLRLLRGASPAGLAVLPPRNRELIRPFLRARRKDIVAHISRHELPYSADPSNLDPRFLRSRVRHELLPLLEGLSPGIVGHLNGLADDVRARLGDDQGSYDAAYVPPLPRATRVALAALAASRSKTGRVLLPHGLVVSFDPSAREPSTRKARPSVDRALERRELDHARKPRK
jgi:tRNA(Ile)-lysidine synthase